MSAVESYPFENVTLPDNIVEGQFSKIAELEEQGYLVKTLTREGLESFLENSEHDPTLIDKPYELLKVVKEQTNILMESNGGIREFIPQNDLIIYGNDNKDAHIALVMKKVEGLSISKFPGMEKLYDSPDLQQKFVELITASFKVLDETSVADNERHIPDILQVYYTGEANFRNIIIGSIDDENENVWLVDTFPVLTMRNDSEVIRMLKSVSTAMKFLDDKVYDLWWENNYQKLDDGGRFDLLESSDSFEKYRTANGVEGLENNKSYNIYLLKEYFKEEYWDQENSLWVNTRQKVSEKIELQLEKTRQRIVDDYKKHTSEILQSKSGYELVNVVRSEKSIPEEFVNICGDGVFFLAVDLTSLENTIDNGLTLENATVAINTSTNLFTSSKYFLDHENNLTQNDGERGACLLAFTGRGNGSRMNDLPNGTKIEENGNDGNVVANSKDVDYYVKGYQIDAIVVLSDEAKTFASRSVLESKYNYIPVMQIGKVSN